MRPRLQKQAAPKLHLSPSLLTQKTFLLLPALPRFSLNSNTPRHQIGALMVRGVGVSEEDGAEISQGAWGCKLPESPGKQKANVSTLPSIVSVSALAVLSNNPLSVNTHTFAWLIAVDSLQHQSQRTPGNVARLGGFDIYFVSIYECWRVHSIKISMIIWKN